MTDSFREEITRVECCKCRERPVPAVHERKVQRLWRQRCGINKEQNFSILCRSLFEIQNGYFLHGREFKDFWMMYTTGWY